MTLKNKYFYYVLRRSTSAEHSAFLSPSVPHPAAVPRAVCESLPTTRADLFNPLAFSPLPPSRPSVHSISRPSTNASPTLSPAFGLLRADAGAQEEENRSIRYNRVQAGRKTRARARANVSSFRELSPPRARVLYADIPFLSRYSFNSCLSLPPALLFRLPHRSTSILNRCHPPPSLPRLSLSRYIFSYLSFGILLPPSYTPKHAWRVPRTFLTAGTIYQ